MRKEKRRLAIELSAGGAVILLAVFLLIGFQYQDYQDKTAIVAGALKAEGKKEELLLMLKGREEISDPEAKELLKRYGYQDCQASGYGRRFLGESVGTAVAGVLVFLGYAAVLLYEKRQKEKQREEEYLNLAGKLEEIRNGSYEPDPYGDHWEENPGEGRIEEQLESLRGYLELVTEKADRDKEETKRLVTEISHQLKTPVSALSSCFEILQRKNLTKEEKKEFELRLEGQLKGLKELVGELVDISRLETGMIEIRLRREKLFDTVLEAVNRIWEKAEAKRIEIELEAEDELEEITFPHDKKWFCEALLNVLENGVKYSPKNTRILIKMEARPLSLRIEVHDQGIGIPKEEYHKIFQRFYRGGSQKVQEEEGQGVGLYLARKIVQEHHGMIFVDGRQMKREKGSVFVIQLPYRKSLTEL